MNPDSSLVSPQSRDREGAGSPLFRSFWMGGFESSCQINSEGARIDMIAELGHDVSAAADYRLLREAGLTGARDAVRWHLVDRGGKYDWSSWIKAAERGFYGYDWNAPAGQYVPGYPYKIMASPKNPLTLPELPADVQSWVSLIHFDVEFDTAEEVSPELAFAEVNL